MKTIINPILTSAKEIEDVLLNVPMLAKMHGDKWACETRDLSLSIRQNGLSIYVDLSFIQYYTVVYGDYFTPDEYKYNYETESIKIDAPISFEKLTDDIVAFINQLGLTKEVEEYEHEKEYEQEEEYDY